MAVTALIVEDGTIVSGADSYTSLPNAEQIVEDWNPPGRATWDLAASTDDLKTAWLRLACRTLEDSACWKGTITDHGTPQDRLFPRIGLFDREGRDIDENVVPVPIQVAQVFIAVGIGDSKIVRRDQYRKLAKKEKLDVLEVEYQEIRGAFNGRYEFDWSEVERLIVPDYATKIELGGSGGVSIGKMTRHVSNPYARRYPRSY